MSTLADLALTELAHRRAVAREMVARREVTTRKANDRLAPWAALTRYYDAPLPAELCPPDGSQLDWIDFYPADMRADHALSSLAKEVRRAAIQIHARHAERPIGTNDALTDRARGLIKLDEHLSIMACLGPIDLRPAVQEEVAA